MKQLGRRSGISRVRWSGPLPVLALDFVSHLLGPPQIGRGGSVANGVGLAVSATQRALGAADLASAMGMETRAAATAITSVGSASARTILRVPIVRSALQDTMGTPGKSGTGGAGQRGLRDPMGSGRTALTLSLLYSAELVAPASGSVGVVPSSPTCPPWLWAPDALGDCCLQVVRQPELDPACPTVCGLSRPQKCYSPVLLGPSVPHSPLLSLQTAVPLAL